MLGFQTILMVGCCLHFCAKGARVIEKHFTLNKQGPDHWFSVDTREFREYVENIRLIENVRQ